MHVHIPIPRLEALRETVPVVVMDTVFPVVSLLITVVCFLQPTGRVLWVIRVVTTADNVFLTITSMTVKTTVTLALMNSVGSRVRIFNYHS